MLDLIAMRNALVMSLLALFVAMPALAQTPASSDQHSAALARVIALEAPTRIDVSTRDVVVEVPVTIKPVGISGTIRKITFSNMAINNIPFDVEPIESAFDLPEKEPMALPEPLRLRVTFLDVAPGLIEEAIYPSDTLHLTGTVAIDGTFKKWLFSFDRKVEAPIDVSRANPLARYHPGRYFTEKLGTWLP